ncbi:hypothetical protein PR202_gb19721 [Eleusine coracana subsp. coracana]|uniref:Uncharacterized protein n=1 Tax=Eleusine coracana subsp. coracana TaxID=191504 RepID=A0AAV5F6P6_ELECO|nr:hypothetical protein PR202_gb19721 [Eleusine coracana subsp. coracana]
MSAPAMCNTSVSPVPRAGSNVGTDKSHRTAGSDVPTITPDAAAANGSPSTALQQSSRHLYLLSLPHCFILLSATLLLLLL